MAKRKLKRSRGAREGEGERENNGECNSSGGAGKEESWDESKLEQRLHLEQ